MNAVLAVVYADVPGFPAGSVVATISATLVGTLSTTPITQTVPPGTTSITFANVAADTYTFSVAGEDASTNIFGSPVTGSFTITAPATVTLTLPTRSVSLRLEWWHRWRHRHRKVTLRLPVHVHVHILKELR